MSRWITMTRLAAVWPITLATLAATATLVAGGEPAERRWSVPEYGEPRMLAELENQAIIESSGIAASRRMPGVFWTHNDSGYGPHLYAIDQQGRHLGRATVDPADSIDWEDIASLEIDGTPFLLVGDVGDNRRRRDSYTLYLVEEPGLGESTARPWQTIHFRYPDGPHDTEAVAYDPPTRSVLLVTKGLLFAHVYQLPLPRRSGTYELEAERVGRLLLPQVTAMDIAADGRYLVLLTYGDAAIWERRAGQTWPAVLEQPGHVLRMPPRRQGEAIAFGADGYDLYLTSEWLPTPLWKVPVAVPPAERAPEESP